MSKIDPATGLQINDAGQIVLNPVIGWTTSTLAETGVLLAIQYISKPEELQTGGKTLQFALTPPQCLDLAAKLTNLANRLMDTKPDKSVN